MNSQRRRRSARPSAPEVEKAPQPHAAEPAKGASRLGIAAAVVVTLACLFNGRSALAMALLAVFTGVGLIVTPPRWRLPGPLLAAAGVVLLLGAVTLLPAAWLNSHPAWQYTLAETWQIILPTSASPQPDLTLGAWLTTLIGCGWFFLLLGNSLPDASRQPTLRWLVGGMALLTLIAVASKFELLALNWPLGYASGKDDLGPFPNRNHFAGFSAIGAILSAATAYDAYRKSSPVWLPFAAGFFLFAASISLNTSRAGVGLLFIGVLLWLATASISKDFLKRLAIAASLILAAVAVLTFQKEGVGARLFDPETGVITALANSNGRTNIQLETLWVVLDTPLRGIGLGQFDAVFALVHRLPEHFVRFTHPESDWLWWAAESGLLLLATLALSLVWVVQARRQRHRKSVHSKSDSQNLRLRLAALIGVALALIHSLVDVPLHNAGIAFLTLLLAALAVAPDRLQTVASPSYRHAFRLLGGVVLMLGLLLALTAMGTPLYPGRLRLDAERTRTQALVNDGHYGEALDRVSAQLRHTPLQWDLYYQAATLRLALRQPPDAALADFNRARALEPNNLDLCYEEGKLWLRHEPTYAIIPWRELIHRFAARSHYYLMMLSEAQSHPETLRDLRRLAQTSPMILTALAYTPTGGEWQTLLTRLLESDPDLTQLEVAERTQLFQLWLARGDRAALVAALETNLNWQAQGWQILADEFAQASQFEKAWGVQKRFALSEAHLAGQSAMKENLQQLERNHLLNPTDLRRGVDLFYALKAAKRLVEAQRLLERLIAMPDSPNYLRQELARLHAQQRDFRRAYETLKDALGNRS